MEKRVPRMIPFKQFFIANVSVKTFLSNGESEKKESNIVAPFFSHSEENERAQGGVAAKILPDVYLAVRNRSGRRVSRDAISGEGANRLSHFQIVQNSTSWLPQVQTLWEGFWDFHTRTLKLLLAPFIGNQNAVKFREIIKLLHKSSTEKRATTETSSTSALVR